MACILGDLEDENEDALYIYKVNVNYDKALAEQYKVMSAQPHLFRKTANRKAK